MSEYDYEEQVNALDMNQMAGHTPEQIAEALFTHEPKEPWSCQMLANPGEASVTHLFEILLIILVKGIEVLSGDLNKADLSNLTSEHITNLNPWIKSLGFTVKVESLDKEDTELYEEYYCRILIKDKVNAFLFEQRGFPNNYHFLLNGTYLEENENKKNLAELFAVFNSNKDVFKISFDHFIPPTKISTTQLL